jgi:HPt (histidine-containing phosphotransfer) domain-containing protein
MTLQELYEKIGGDYEQAQRVLRMDKLIDKHIKKLASNGVVDDLIAAGDEMDPAQLFETAHAVKGVCANLGLVGISEAASEIAEEYRPGNSRNMTDDEVKAKLAEIADMYKKAAEGINEYAAE